MMLHFLSSSYHRLRQTLTRAQSDNEALRASCANLRTYQKRLAPELRSQRQKMIMLGNKNSRALNQIIKKDDRIEILEYQATLTRRAAIIARSIPCGAASHHTHAPHASYSHKKA